MMDYEELDNITREWMLKEFDAEQTQDNHYQIKTLNQNGLKAFPDIMKKAIQKGNIESLTKDLLNDSLWNSHTYRRGKNGYTSVKINVECEAKKLAHSEFNTFFTRGMARRLMEEGKTECEVYRSGKADKPKCECTGFEGMHILVKEIYDGHRAKYFPKGNPSAFSIPTTPWCHHTIKRIKNDESDLQNNILSEILA